MQKKNMLQKLVYKFYTQNIEKREEKEIEKQSYI